MRIKSDMELLGAYAETGNPEAFAEIVSRYGAVVYQVCFRKLFNRQDAEDASQAVFMTLVKKAGKMKKEGSLAGWLHKVARETAQYAARTRINRIRKESAAAEAMDAESHPLVTASDREMALKVLDEELDSLSAVQREAVILRYLKGLCEKDAAAFAGCAPNTLTCRGNDGLSHLRQRMLRRGCALSVPALIGILDAEANAAIPETLIPSLMAVPKMAAAGAVAGTASASIINIMKGALTTMASTNIKTVGVGILIALLTGTAGVMAVREIQKGQAPVAS